LPEGRPANRVTHRARGQQPILFRHAEARAQRS
jgi:hypothetical protein